MSLQYSSYKVSFSILGPDLSNTMQMFMLPSWTQMSKSGGEEKEGCHTTSQSNPLYGSTVPGQGDVIVSPLKVTDSNSGWK